MGEVTEKSIAVTEVKMTTPLQYSLLGTNVLCSKEL